MPDAPINLANNVTVTSATQIGIRWDEGHNNNGSPVIDYTISYDQSTGVWVNLTTSLTAKFYTTLVGLSPGRTYSFRVYARNSVGYSSPAVISILCAQKPNPPVTPITYISNTSVVVNWT